MIKWVEGVGDVNVHFEAVVWPGAFAQCECHLGEPLDLVVRSHDAVCEYDWRERNASLFPFLYT
jgi:hypothetical protein